MPEQIGSSSNDTPPTLTFYVKTMGSRRELIPGDRDGKKGYLCVTITNTGPQPQDRTLDNQTAFEKVLEDMRLLDPKSPTRKLGPSWPDWMEESYYIRRQVADYMRTSLPLRCLYWCSLGQ